MRNSLLYVAKTEVNEDTNAAVGKKLLNSIYYALVSPGGGPNYFCVNTAGKQQERERTDCVGLGPGPKGCGGVIRRGGGGAHWSNL